MQRFRLDALAIGLPSLCMLPCVASLARLFALGSPSAFGRVEEVFHLVMLAIIVPVSLLAIGMGYRRHRWIWRWMPCGWKAP